MCALKLKILEYSKNYCIWALERSANKDHLLQSQVFGIKFIIREFNENFWTKSLASFQTYNNIRKYPIDSVFPVFPQCSVY